MRTSHYLAPALIGISLLACSQAGAEAEEGESSIVTDTGERKPRHTVVPVYPKLARRERVEGDVQVCFHVDREGRPHGVKVRRSTNRIFEKPSLVAARASTFEPLLPGTKLSGVKTCRTFRFRLNPVAIERPE
jgi:TonB family protein